MLFICLYVCLLPKCVPSYAKRDFFFKISNHTCGLCWQPIGSPAWAIQITYSWTPKIQDGWLLPSWKSLNRYISTKIYPVLIKFGTQQQIWNSMTARWPKMEIFKMRDGGQPHWKSFCGHSWVADCPMSVKFCVGKQFFTEFRQWDRYPGSAERISCFHNAVWASASGGFSYRVACFYSA